MSRGTSRERQHQERIYYQGLRQETDGNRWPGTRQEQEARIQLREGTIVSWELGEKLLEIDGRKTQR
jgi:hypothetical protein